MKTIDIKMSEWVKGAFAALGGIASYIWGPWDALCMTLVAFVAMDYITGVAKAAVLKALSSSIGFHGLLKKLFIFVLVGAATLVDRVIPEANGAIRAAVMLFYIANEGISIIENAAELGLPIPKALLKAFAKFEGEEKA